MSLVAHPLVSIPRVAVFRLEEGDSASFKKLFLRPDYSVRFVENTRDILKLIEEERAEFDAIVVPITSVRGPHGVTRILDIKGEGSLMLCPVVGLSLSRSLSLIRPFFEAGVDTMLYGPFEGDLLHCELSSVARFSAMNRDARLRQSDQALLSDPGLGMLDTLPWGTGILTASFNITFLSRAARKILGITEPSYEGIAAREIKRALEMLGEQGHLPIVDREVVLQRPFGPPALVRLFVSEVRGKRASRLGYFFAVTELNQYQAIGHSLEQSRRIRRIFALLASYFFSDRVAQTLSVGSGNIAKLQEALEREPRECSLGACCHTLLEMLDPVFGNEVSVTLSGVDESTLPMKRSDLLSTMTILILWLIEQSGGLTDVTISLSKEGQSRVLSLTSETQTIAPLAPDPFLLKLSEGTPLSPRDKELPLSLPQEITSRYGLKLSISSPSSTYRIVKLIFPE